MQIKIRIILFNLIIFGSTLQIINLNSLNAQSFPYEIELEEFTIPGLNGVHSFAAAENGGKLLIISGRKDGMHRGGGGNNNPPFPSSNNNTTIYVVDPASNVAWSTSNSSLPTAIKDQMSSTNTSFYQDGNNLYIVGGYGANSSGNYVTYANITAIDVPSIISNIINGTSIVNDFIQLSDNRMAIAGGQLGKIGNTFYLVGGMELQGKYSMMVNPIYSSEIRLFNLTNNGGNLVLSNYSTMSNSEFHRRDYNLVPNIYPDGSFGYLVSSGVFTPNDGVFYNPIEIKSTGYTVIPEATFKQEFSHYQSANLSMYDPVANNMHNIFFGGIAQYYYDVNGTKINDTTVPFVKTISRVTRDLNGVYSESVFSTQMPVYVGAGSELFLNENLATVGHGIIDMSQLSGNSITVGYIFGGLLSNASDIFPMNVSNSSASSTIYRVKLVQSPLPVELIEFEGVIDIKNDCANASIHLNWKTASEINAKSFEIERSKYGNFERVGSVDANKESNKIIDYSFDDDDPMEGNAYYRLKILDLDGKFTYSDIIVIKGCQGKSLEISPNPTSGKIFILGELNPEEVKIFNQNGIEIKSSIRPINGGYSLDLGQNSAGIYYLINKDNETYKIIKN